MKSGVSERMHACAVRIPLAASTSRGGVVQAANSRVKCEVLETNT